MRRLLLAAVLAAAACGNTSTSSSPLSAGVDGPPPPDASFDAGPLHATGRVGTQHPGAQGDPVPIAGAQVCIVGHPEVACGTSLADGSYGMEVPLAVQQEPQLAFVTTADGWLGEVNHYLEGDAGFTSPSPVLLSNADATAALATDAGFTYAAPDTTDGFVLVNVIGLGPPLAGATATITPAIATGAVYERADGTPDPSLTATSGSGVLLFGNVPPGPFTVTVTAPGKTCATMDYGSDWRSSTNQVSGVVAAGAVSDDLFIVCQ